jgi:hypothetical protein
MCRSQRPHKVDEGAEEQFDDFDEVLSHTD